MATTTTSSPNTNGTISQKFVPSFDPQEIAIKSLPGKPVTSPYQGDQIMFILTDNRRWFCDLYVAQTIDQMRLQTGEVFRVQKVSERRGNQAITKVQVTAVVPEVPEPIPAQSASSSDSATHLARCYRDAVDVAVSAMSYAREKGLAIRTHV